ncbi:hypothetical protein Tco_0382801 [Tanacetum coccineum]
MVDSQPMEEEIQGAKARDVGTETHGGPTEPVLQTQKTPSPSPTFIKENINVFRAMIKEHDQQAKTKALPRRLAYADSNKGTLARQACSTGKSQRTPSRNKEPSGLRRSRKLEDQSRTKEKQEGQGPSPEGKGLGIKKQARTLNTRKRAKLPQNIRVYEGNKDPEDHLSIFLPAAEQEEWSMLVCQKFLEEFSQQNRYSKDRTEIHGIKRRQNEGLQAFMDRFKSESSHIKGVHPVLRISAFMHGHGHLELANKLNKKIPKTVDEMFERVRAFIRGEVVAISAEMVRPSQWDKGNIHRAWSGGPEKARNRGGDPGHGKYELSRTTPFNCNPQKLELDKFLITTEDRGPTPQFATVKKADRRSYGLGEVGLSGKGYPLEQPEERFSEETYHPLGVIDLRVTMREAGRNKMVLMEFLIVKCRSPYNVIIGRTRMRSLEAVGSTIHSMIKFPTNQGIVTIETSREALWKCRQLERVQGWWKEVQWRQREEQMSRIREQ